MALPYATENQLKLLEQKTKAELDKKTENVNLTADTLDDMNALITKGRVTDGQLCYCKADKKLYVLKDNVWSEVGGGGASVSPMLNLMDFSGDSIVARTSITEEEKQNIEKGLYNSVLYIDFSLGGASIYSIYSSEPAFYMDGTFIFSIYKFSLDETTESGSITSLRVYGLSIGEKNPDETYPITIESLMEIPFGGGSSNLPVLDLSTYEANTILTDAQITAIEDYSTKGFINVKLPKPFNIVPESLNIGFVTKKDGVDYKNSFIELCSSPISSLIGGSFLSVITLFRITYEITDDKKLKLEYIELPEKGSFSGDGFLAWDDTENKMVWKQLSTISPTTIVKNAVDNKVTITEEEFDKLASGNYSLSISSTNSSGFTSSLIFTDVHVKALSEGKPDNIEAISSSIVFNDPIIVQKDYRLNFSRNNLVSDVTSSFTTMTQSKLLNKKVMTYGSYSPENILPCTSADNGKVLSVVNGEAQWSSASGEKTLTISITDILTDNSKIQELFSKMTSTTEQSALISFDNPISYDTYKDYDTIKLDLSPLSSMGVSGYYILRNQSHVNGYTPVYSLTTVGFSTSGNNLDKLVIKHLIIAGNDEVNTPLNKFLLKIL